MTKAAAGRRAAHLAHAVRGQGQGPARQDLTRPAGHLTAPDGMSGGGRITGNTANGGRGGQGGGTGSNFGTLVGAVARRNVRAVTAHPEWNAWISGQLFSSPAAAARDRSW